MCQNLRSFASYKINPMKGERTQKKYSIYWTWIAKAKQLIILKINFTLIIMEKSKSFPEYSSSFSGEFDFDNQSNSYIFNGPSSKGNGFATSSDPEIKRKKRIASYNVFTVENKLKSSVRNSFKWIKGKFSDVRYGNM